MNYSLISFTGLHSGSFRTKLAMELCSSGHVQNDKETKHANVVGKDIKTNSTIMEPASSETKNEKTFVFGSAENLVLPTVFEGKITNERKVSKQENLSTAVNLRTSGSNQDIRSVDPRPLSPFPSRFVPQRSLDDNSIHVHMKGKRRIQRNFSSPLSTGEKKTSVLGLEIKGRSLSDSPAEVLVSPVIPRRHFDSENFQNTNKSQAGVSRVKSCPSIKADSNEPVTKFTLLRTALLSRSPSTDACPTLTEPAEQADRLPRIQDSRSPILVRTRKSSSECARELFNVSPIMDKSSNTTNKADDDNLQCNVTDKVEYYLYSMSVEDDHE